MGKNAHLHIVLDTEFLENLKQQAKKRGLSVSELCRQKMSDNLQLDKIEYIVEQILKQNEKYRNK